MSFCGFPFSQRPFNNEQRVFKKEFRYYVHSFFFYHEDVIYEGKNKKQSM